jgi:GAF domain-containing protein
VATLVAGGTASAEVFAAVASEVAHVLGLPLVEMSRFEPDGTATVIGAWSECPHLFPARLALASRRPRRSRLGCCRPVRPARIDDYAGIRGTIAGAARTPGVRSAAGAPIIVDGEQLVGNPFLASFRGLVGIAVMALAVLVVYRLRLERRHTAPRAAGETIPASAR